MAINPNYKKPDIVAGDMNTPVTFFEFGASDGPDPGEEEKDILYSAMALVYNPTMKDKEYLNAKGTQEGITIKIRDPYLDYQPNNTHKVILDDFRYQEKAWDIVNVSPDLENNAFIKIVLGVTS